MTTQETFTFRGKTYTEAVQKITAALGKDFYVVERRDVKDGGGMLGGLLGGGDEMVEIIAAPISEATAQASVKPKQTLLQKTYCGKPEAEELPSGDAPRKAVLEGSGKGIAAKLDGISAELIRDQSMLKEFRAEIRALFSLQARGGLPAVRDELLNAYAMLTEVGVEEGVARKLVEAVQKEDGPLQQLMIKAIGEQLKVAGPLVLKENGPTVAAIVGPSGVGKTTTVARLAVEFVYRRNRCVGIISEGIRRPGADAQLRNLSQLLSVPVVYADSPERLAEEAAHMSEMDLILVDTAGRSPRDLDAVSELGLGMEAVGASEVHLAVTAETSLRFAREVIESFSAARFNRLILSKVDEASVYGNALSIGVMSTEPLSYMTLGHEYTETLVPVDEKVLAHLVLGIESVDPLGRGFMPGTSAKEVEP